MPDPPGAGAAVPFTSQQVALLERVIQQCGQGQIAEASIALGRHLAGIE